MYGIVSKQKPSAKKVETNDEFEVAETCADMAFLVSDWGKYRASFVLESLYMYGNTILNEDFVEKYGMRNVQKALYHITGFNISFRYEDGNGSWLTPFYVITTPNRVHTAKIPALVEDRKVQKAYNELMKTLLLGQDRDGKSTNELRDKLVQVATCKSKEEHGVFGNQGDYDVWFEPDLTYVKEWNSEYYFSTLNVITGYNLYVELFEELKNSRSKITKALESTYKAPPETEDYEFNKYVIKVNKVRKWAESKDGEIQLSRSVISSIKKAKKVAKPINCIKLRREIKKIEETPFDSTEYEGDVLIPEDLKIDVSKKTTPNLKDAWLNGLKAMSEEMDKLDEEDRKAEESKKEAKEAEVKKVEQPKVEKPKVEKPKMVQALDPLAALTAMSKEAVNATEVSKPDKKKTGKRKIVSTKKDTKLKNISRVKKNKDEAVIVRVKTKKPLGKDVNDILKGNEGMNVKIITKGINESNSEVNELMDLQENSDGILEGVAIADEDIQNYLNKKKL